MIISNNPANQPLRGKKICLDPGHGGRDPGAQGKLVDEKDVNLQVALKEKAVLESLGADVVMTRSDDLKPGAELELQERCDIANKAKVDVFVSIHHNANPKPEVKGTESYYYAEGSKESFNLAKMSAKETSAAAETINRGAFPCHFYVLKHTDMPAMLMEMGYLSNREEEKFISQPVTQDKLAAGMAKAILTWFTTSPSNMEEKPPLKQGVPLPEEPPPHGKGQA